jgi:hypothetical protein
MKLIPLPALLFSAFVFTACGGTEDTSELDLTDDELTAQPAPPLTPIPPIPLQPDLIVGSFNVTAPPVLHCGPQTLSFTATESNVGTANAGRHYLHLQRQNPFSGAWLPTAAIPLSSLAAGATRPLAGTFNFYNGPCDCLPSTYTITFRLFDDGGDLVTESNEGNNASNTIVVAAACP